ncbi:MAG: 1-acyl-sn-glycerol-3-phosphate acyltransferase [Bacteroidia bacterium]
MSQSEPASSTDYRKEGILLPPVIPKIKDWPIARLLKDKSDFLEPVIEEAMQQLLNSKKGSPLELLESTMFRERARIKEEPWKVDPKDEMKFWSGVKKRLVNFEQEESNPEAQRLAQEAMVREIVERYSTEIASVFRPGTYHFAKRILPFLFSILLNASAGKTIRSLVKDRLGLQDKVHLTGEVEAIRSLATKGTVVLVPTHFSNVDSILIGWGLHALGLPAFIYGAGLNLFNNKILAYFMSRIGAYKLDRRKRNPIYRAVLDAYSTTAISRGAHSLFFPGGTRSRDGSIEKKLKLGLLGTAMESQRRAFLPEGDGGKIFIVPMVMSYHFVLEGNSLISQHLKRTGQEQYYILNDEFASYRKFLNFVWKTFGRTSDITLNFGKPLDLFGNFVDQEGRSFDNNGREVDIKQYFMLKGEITKNVQRDQVYTKMLGDKIIERFHAENVVFSSHLAAFVAFEMLKKRNPDFDLYGLLRLPEEDRELTRIEVYSATERVVTQLKALKAEGKVCMAEHLEKEVPDIIAHGVRNLGLFHSKRPLRFENDHLMTSDNMNLLYFYHNRLTGYDLEQYI